jgi:glutamate dehydrogenase (NAD(P)+)
VDNASEINADMVAELANDPAIAGADEILYKNGVHVIPDILCNAGGVIVSYFEMVQNFDLWSWEEAEVSRFLDKRMIHAYEAVLAASRETI